MRIKFNKGLTPEAIAALLLQVIEERDMVIGSVNVYIQEYGEDMKAIPSRRDDEYIEINPTEKGKQRYDDYVVDMRRSKLKAI